MEPRRFRGRFGRHLRTPLASLLALTLLVGTGCRMKPEETSGVPPPRRAIADVIRAHTTELLDIPGVVGLYEGELEDHTPCIKIMVVERTPELEARLPRELEGYPVRIDVTGVIQPLDSDSG